MIHTSGAELELSKLCMLHLDEAAQGTCHRVMEHLAENKTTCSLPMLVPSPPQTETTGVSTSAIGVSTSATGVSNAATGGVFAGGFAVGILVSVTVAVV